MRMPALAASAAVIALFTLAQPAAAVSLNPRGLGQVLLYPYYTVNKGQDTLLTVANVSDRAKVVKLRVLEGYNGRTVLDFNLYLSAHDLWNATISSSGGVASAAQINTNDRSCVDFLPTLPYLFRSYGYDGTLAGSGEPADSGPHTVERTREGHFEIIALADIVPGSALETAITHVQTGTANGGIPAGASGSPGNCPNIAALTGQDNQLVAPTSGLLGSAAIINIGEGTFFAYNADAITGFSDSVLINAIQSPSLSLESANSLEATNGRARAYLSTNNGRQFALDFQSGRDAVSAVLMADALYNEYLVSPGLGANTDWVVTFPTKRFYVDQGLYAGSPIPPFDERFGQTVPGRSAVQVATRFYDREEGTPALDNCPGNPPACPLVPHLAYEVNVVSFRPGAPSGVFGSGLTDNLLPYADSGWMKLDLSQHALAGGVTPGGSNILVKGLPVTGFMVYNIINANAAPGRLANYGGTFPHRTTVSCSYAAAGSTGGDPCL